MKKFNDLELARFRRLKREILLSDPPGPFWSPEEIAEADEIGKILAMRAELGRIDTPATRPLGDEGTMI